MNARIANVILSLIFLSAFNIAAWMIAHKGLWPWDYTWYLYWAETMIVGGLALFMYAKHLLIFFFLLIIVSYMAGLKNITFMGDMKIPMTFWALYSLFWLVYFETRRSILGHSIRQLHPMGQLIYYFTFMAVAVAGSCALTGLIYFGQAYVPGMQATLLQQCLAIAIGIPTLTISLLKIVDMIGEQHVFYFLLGTYHRPEEKKRIVVFFDMVGSSAVAERLPPKKSMELIANFIFDACHSCRVNGGDIVNYTGDGLMVLWPLFQSDKVVRAYDMLINRLESRRVAYEGSYGMVPDFRMGIHAGNVVISQIGEEKLFLGVYGDVVNTASRIEQMNKQMGTRILLSRSVRQHMSQNVRGRTKSLGKVEIRGRDEMVEIFTVS
ncbi:MAG: adenylate/guanylate cyclase domain-containing protein [Alphaproteobacteria bacterium]